MTRLSCDRFRHTGPQAAADPGADDDGPQGTADGQRLEMYGDSAYGSGQARADYRDGGHDTVIKPGPLRPAVPGGFTIDDFTVSEQDGTVTCPNGVTRQMSTNRAVTFGAACAGCPLRERCTTARDGRSMTIHPHEGLLREARAQARTPEFRQACPTRSSIERTIAWIDTCNGRRIRLRYIGTARNDAWLHNRCAGLNLRTLVKRRPDPLWRRLDPGLTGEQPPARAAPARWPGAQPLSAGHQAPHITKTRGQTRTAHCMPGPRSEHRAARRQICS